MSMSLQILFGSFEPIVVPFASFGELRRKGQPNRKERKKRFSANELLFQTCARRLAAHQPPSTPWRRWCGVRPAWLAAAESPF